MSGSIGRWPERVGSWPLALRAGVLLFAAAVIFAVLCPVAIRISGSDGAAALTVASLVCLAGMLSALLVGEVLTAPQLAVHNLGAGMLLRMGIPLAAVVVVYLVGGRLAEGGMAQYLLIFYPVLLGVETGLTLCRQQYANR